MDLRTSNANWIGILAIIVLASALAGAQVPSSSEAQLQLADVYMGRMQFQEALIAYRVARDSDNPNVRLRAGAGSVQALLRLSRYREATLEGESVASRDPSMAAAIAIHADTLWAAGWLSDAEARYDHALRLDPGDPRALHGRARSLAARGQFDRAIEAVNGAIAAAPREPVYYYTLSSIYERRPEFDRAADTLATYLRLLPAEDDREPTRWAQRQERFLRTFEGRTPMEMATRGSTFVVPIRVEDGRVLVTGRVNGSTRVSFALDTGADQTLLTPAVAHNAGVVPAVPLESAGIGGTEDRFRGLQIGRADEIAIGPFAMRNVPVVIKSPALTGLPRPEGAAFSPLALGWSLVIDYRRKSLTLARRLPEPTSPIRLPLYLHRLPIVSATVNGMARGSFVIDTASDGSALSHRLVEELPVDPRVPRVPARVYGSAGWDQTAFLLPYVDLDVARGIGLSRRALVVLNLDAPSALLGFRLGGIIGQELLMRYIVTIDLVRSEVGLRPIE